MQPALTCLLAPTLVSGKAGTGHHVDGDVLRFGIGDTLVKTAARTSTGEVRKKRASIRKEA